MALVLDKVGLGKEILKNLKYEMSFALESWEAEVFKFMNYNEFKKKADMDYEIMIRYDSIIAYLEANTYVLADSYGTGSLMLLDNPGLKEYMSKKGKEQGEWNPYRVGNAISGRELGDYTDVFGKPHHTSGAFKGKILEGIRVRAGYEIRPVAPSRAVEAAEGWLYRTYLPNAYKRAIEKVNMAKFLIEK